MTTRVYHSKSLVELGERKEVPAVPMSNTGPPHDVPAVSKQRRYVIEERENS